MMRVFAARFLTRVDFVRSLLESDGIPCFIKNEHGAHTAGGGFGSAMAFTWPEIWVDEEDYERAAELVAQFKGDSDTPRT